MCTSRPKRALVWALGVVVVAPLAAEARPPLHYFHDATNNKTATARRLMDKTECAAEVIYTVQAFIHGVYDIAAGLPDCGVDGKPEDCAADILGVLSSVFDMSSQISGAAGSCSEQDYPCWGAVSDALVATADLSGDLIGAAVTCKAPDALLMCTYNVFVVVNDFNGLVDSLWSAVDDCKAE